MPQHKRSKTNTKYFDDLPRIKDKKQLAYEKSRSLANLVTQRSYLLVETREKRKKIYNLSMEINSIQNELASLFSTMNKDGVKNGLERPMLAAEDRLDIP